MESAVEDRGIGGGVRIMTTASQPGRGERGERSDVLVSREKEAAVKGCKNEQRRHQQNTMSIRSPFFTSPPTQKHAGAGFMVLIRDRLL